MNSCVESSSNSKVDSKNEKYESEYVNPNLNQTTSSDSMTSLDSIAKTYLINTNRFYDNLAYLKLTKIKNGIEYKVIHFGRNTRLRFITDFSIYINQNLEIFEYNKITDELERYTHNEKRKCDFATLLWIDSLSQKRELNEKDIYTLFKSINPHCKSNVEYSQMINEYLWKALESKPQDFAWTIRDTHLSSAIKRFIIEEVGSPINDNIDPKFVLNSIEEMDHKQDQFLKQLINVIRKIK